MSITHVHILAALNAELLRCPRGPKVRLLDMGCGDGRLIQFLDAELPRLNPSIEFEIHGFDVADGGVQSAGFISRTVESLRLARPDVSWEQRIAAIRVGEEWPYASSSFDFVISNQVLEHVADPDFALRQVERALKAGGVSLHLFPLREYWMEGHLHIPFVHWIHDHDLLFSWIRFWNRLGIGIYSPKRALAEGEPFEEHVERHADYMAFSTFYITHEQACLAAKRAGLRVSFPYTHGFYAAKLRSLAGLAPKLVYSVDRWPWLERIALFFLSRVASVTMRLEKTNTYWSRSGYSLANRHGLPGQSTESVRRQ